MATSKVSLKLLINKKTNKVLFAEAGKDFVDFLFTLLSFPLGTVIRLLSKNKMVGCLGNLYQSIEELNDTFIQPNLDKDTVLNPRAPFCASASTLLLSDEGTGANRKVYMCQYYHRNVTDDPKTMCPQCSTRMSYEVPHVAPARNDGVGNVVNSGQDGVFVKGVVTYMVMDNLEVKPMSTISSITMLNRFNIQEVGALEEKVIELGMDEGLNLLKASLQSKTVLTSVFLGA